MVNKMLTMAEKITLLSHKASVHSFKLAVFTPYQGANFQSF
jgi:hypothetical protein